jgi:glutaredoxin
MLCNRHGLAVAPDGTCVLCRREAPRPGHPRWFYALLGFVLFGLMVFAVGREVRKAVIARRARHVASTTSVAPTSSLALPAPSASFSVSALASSDPPPSPTAPDWFAQEQRRLPIERQRVSVTLYETAGCAECSGARTWFRAHNQAFFERDINQDPDARTKLMKLNPTGSVPTIHIDDHVLVGFDAMVVDRTIDAAALHRIAQNPE